MGRIETLTPLCPQPDPKPADGFPNSCHSRCRADSARSAGRSQPNLDIYAKLPPHGGGEKTSGDLSGVVPSVTEASHAVFLSYASQDAEAAQKICEALRAGGIEVFLDQSELRGGDAWDQKIRKRIKTCALFIPVISHATHDRREGYFRLEWKLAVDRSHLMDAELAFLMPVVIDDTRDDDERVPDRFREVQWTRLPGGETPPAFVERIKRLLSPDVAPATQAPANAVPGVAPAIRRPVRVSRRSKAGAAHDHCRRCPGDAGGVLLDLEAPEVIRRGLLPAAALDCGAAVREYERG